ncbi:MAG: ABC transporter ATP-binding protein [Flavobacteriaceae bacterium]|nr:ABC transporter ATP-binding protein [Flavobacteriaceae bacterium]
MNNNILLEVNNLCISTASKNNVKSLVKNISFNIRKNEIIGLLGESGSGKSLTSLAILKLLNKDQFKVSGEILFQEKDLLKIEDYKMLKIRGAEISMIFQEPMSALNPTMKIGKQLSEVYKIHQAKSNFNIQKKIKQLIKKVKLEKVENILQKYPHEISGGQKQRIMIIMALACKPKLLIADEPTTALDLTVQKEIIKILQSLQKTENLSILFISHDLKLVSKIAHRLIILKDGEIIEKGVSKDIFKTPKSNYTKALLSLIINHKRRPKILPTIKTFDINKKPELQNNVNRLKRQRDIYSKEPILKINNVSKFYNTSTNLFVKNKEYKALENVDLNLYAGETLGLIGESGSGKSTLSNAILKIHSFEEGKIYYEGKDISILRGKDLLNFRKQVQIIFQDPYTSLNPMKNIQQTISEPIKYHRLILEKKEILEKVIELLNDVGLDETFLSRYPHELSGGQRQRVCIARAISLKPKIIICDECVSALDVSVQATILNLLNSLKNKYNFTYMFISHDLSVVRYMSDRIVVLFKGKIVEYEEADKLFSEPKNDYTKKLIKSSTLLCL